MHSPRLERLPRYRRLTLGAVIPILAAAAHALQNGVARVPPVGWNHWNAFHCGITEEIVRQTADSMASNGMQAVGYQYVNVDDCWESTTRDAQGRLQNDPETFPSGIKALADYVHAKGLKLGVYSSAGTTTCGGRAGSNGHEDLDAQTFAAWGVDYLKYDGCGDIPGGASAGQAKMRDALAKTGRPMVFSTALQSPGPKEAPKVVNLARTTLDIEASWRVLSSIIEQQVGNEYFAGPGYYNDPDMLEIGNDDRGTLTDTEARTHFSMWCILAAPLLAGNDIRTMTPAVKAILTNAEAIAIDQDSLGIQGQRVSTDSLRQVWMRPLKGGGRAAALYNRGEAAADIRVDWSQLGWPADHKATVRDLWEHADKGQYQGSYSANVPAHGTVLLRLAPEADKTPPKIQYVLADADRPGVVRVYFDRVMDRASAGNAANYSIDGGATVKSARLDSQRVRATVLNPERRMVVLEVAGLSGTGARTLTVGNLKDTAGNVLATQGYALEPQVRLAGTAEGKCPDSWAKAVDKDTTTEFFCQGDSSWIGMDLGAQKKLKAAVIWGHDAQWLDPWSQNISNNRLQASNDGANWNDIIAIRRSLDFDTVAAGGNDWTKPYFPAIALFLSPDLPAYRHWRLRSPGTAQINELALYEDKALVVGAHSGASRPGSAPGSLSLRQVAAGWEARVEAGGDFRLELVDARGAGLGAWTGNMNATVTLPRLGSRPAFLRLRAGAATRALALPPVTE